MSALRFTCLFHGKCKTPYAIFTCTELHHFRKNGKIHLAFYFHTEEKLFSLASKLYPQRIACVHAFFHHCFKKLIHRHSVTYINLLTGWERTGTVDVHQSQAGKRFFYAGFQFGGIGYF